MSRGRITGLVVVALASALVALAWGRIVARGRYALPYSADGAGPEGALGLATLLEQRGMTTGRWREELGRLPRGATVLALGGCDQSAARALSRLERASVVRWLEAGGTLVVAGAPGVVPEGLGVELVAPTECPGTSGLVASIVRSASAAARRDEDDAKDPAAPRDDDGGDAIDDARRVGEALRGAARAPSSALDRWFPEVPLPPPVWAHAVGAPFVGMQPVGLRRPAALVVEEGLDVRRTLAVSERTLGLERRVGAGRLVVLASASPFQNRDLATHGGAALALRLLEGARGPILFDEYHLGAGERRSLVRYLAQVGLAPALGQLLLALALGLAWAGARFGAREEAPPEDAAGAGSFVAAVGLLFARSADARGARGLVARDALVRIARAHRVADAPRTLEDAGRLAASLRALRRDAAAEAVEAIAAIGADPAGTRRDLVGHVRAIDAHAARAMAPRAAGDVERGRTP